MVRKPIEMKTPDEKPSEIVDRKIRDAAREPFLPGIRDGFQSFKNKWLEGDIDAKALGLSSKLSPEEAAIAIAGKAQEARDHWRAKAEALGQENIELKKANALLQRRNARYEKDREKEAGGDK
jgi:hypothetical protein